MRLPADATRTVVIAVALVSAGFFAAYLRFLPYLEREATYTDGRAHYELDEIEQLRFAMWDDAESLGVAINGPEHEGRGATSPDGRLLVFAVGEEGLNADLYVADLVDGLPTDPRPLGRVNTTADDIAPTFTADALWFSSNRPGGEGGFDLYRVPYEDGSFGFVETLEPGLNTSADEFDPAPVPGSPAVAFASGRRRAMGLDIYLAAPKGSGLTAAGTLADASIAPAAEAPTDDSSAWTVTPLDELNTPFHDRDPSFTNDGLTLFFASNRSGGAGGFDLYRSVQSAGVWQQPEPLGNLNDVHDERAPSPSRDGFTLLFTSSDGIGDSTDLLRARSLELHRLPGRPVGWLDLTLLGLLLLLALLAWLGKHWEALDILYKCLLVSLLIHLLLAYWFRDVYVENEQVELPPPQPSFRVTLAASPSAIAQQRERNGEVSDAPSGRAQAADAPQRAESAELASLVGEQDAPRPEAGGDLAAPALAGASAPDASTSAAAQPARDAVAAASGLEVSAPSGATATREASETAMVVTARRVSNASDAAAARGSSSPSARPSKMTGESTAASDLAAAPTPTTGDLAMPTLSDGEAPATTGSLAAGARLSSAPAPERAHGAAVPALAALDGGGPTRSAPESAPRLSLDDLADASGGAAGGRSASRGAPSMPTRVSSSTGEGAGADASRAQAPSLGGLAPLAASSGSDRPSTAGGEASSATAAPPRRDGGDGVALAADDGPVSTGRDAAVAQESASDLDVGGLDLDLGSPSRRKSPTAGRRPGRLAASAPTALANLGTVSAPSFAPLSMPVASVDARPVPALEATVAETFAETPYRTRFGDEKLRALEEFGGSEETERAVRLGLGYLASIQRTDGHWGSASDYDEKYGRVTIGKTGLCLLAFLGAGHTPTSDTEHSDVTSRAVDLLLRVQDEDTGHFGYSEAYSHGIATYALAECYALTKLDRLRAPLERAVAQILRNQNRTSDRRRNGGWSYYYPDGATYDRWPRTSITAWQVMALESARLGGLDVPDAVFDAAGGFLRASHRAREGVITYSQDPSRLNSAYWTLPGSTPAGLFALSLLGEDLADDRWDSALRFVRNRAPDGYRMRSQDAFVEEASGNLYFWYYGTLAMFRRGGPEWDTWNTALQDTLLPSQSDDGSWRPISVYSEYAGDTSRDRAYTTAMNVLTLEVYYRYFTPLLEVR